MMDSTHELSMGMMRDGIKLHTTVRYHLAPNGVAERMNEYSPMPCALAIVESKWVPWTWHFHFHFWGGRALLMRPILKVEGQRRVDV